MPKTELDVTCDVSAWTDLPVGQQLLLQLRASVDPVFFWDDPRLGNFPLWEAKKAIFREFYQYDTNGRRLYSELIFMSGMRGGKTVAAAMISLTELYKLLMLKNPQEYYNLAPNTEIGFANIANSRDQAKDTVFRKAEEIIANSPYFMSHNPYVTAYQIKFPKNLTLKALGSNIGSSVGRTLKSFVADEIDDYDDPEDTYFKLSKSTGNFVKWNENIRVMIGSPVTDGGMLTTTYKRATTEKWPDTMCVWKPTWELNPNMDYKTLESQRMKDPLKFDRDFGAEAVSERENLFNRALLSQAADKCKAVQNLFMGEPEYGSKHGFIPQIDFTLLKTAPDAIEYIITADPAVLHDAFGLSVGYLSTNGEHKIIGSTVFKAERNEEINTDDIKDVLTPILETLPVRYYIFDTYLHSGIQQLTSKFGVTAIQHNLVLNDWIYTRNDLYNGILSIPYSEYLFREFRELIIVKNRTVNHQRTGSKDQADTVAQFDSFIRRREQDERQQLKDSNSITHMVVQF